ncbi:hypothetical protein SLS56_008044 [Neofusicoccum ribis]|uniref:Zinc finger RING-type eukaryotic domain-containing protein n=1 Tax=Neofusicoccum ribis TaxID=45134 RepID=A0ABR3SLT1_9PEZI
MTRDQVLSQNIKSKEKTNNFERRDAKEKDLTFTELSKVLADSEPLCKGRPVSLQCGHNFGATCILDAMRWMKYESHREPLRCPYCRKLMTIHQNIIPAYEAIYEKAAKQSRVASAIALRLRPSMILEMGRNMLLPYTRYRLSGGRGSVRNLSTIVRVDGKKLRTDPKEAFELLWHDFMGLAQSAITNEQQQEFARFLKVVLGRAIDEDNWDRGHSL